MTMRRVLVVDDDETILDSLEYKLTSEGFAVTTVRSAGGAVEQARRDAHDLMILDLGLPDGSGLDVCRAVRAESPVPIIVLTARESEIDSVVALELGADDYVRKPFSLAELVGRVRALLRRREIDRESAGGPTVRRVGTLVVDLARHVAVADGTEVPLTRAEFKLLALLSERPEQVYTRRQIMERLWESAYVGDLRACDVHIASLRRKLDPPGDASRIATVRGVGYKLVRV